jgi:DNA-binding MltR family transcriptional regulator
MFENADNDEVDFAPFIIAGRDLERQLKIEDALLEFSRLFQPEEENGRAIAIVGAAFLDMQLSHILLNFLVDDDTEAKRLLQYDQPLGTYGSRIGTAYCLGLIGQMVRDDLRLIGKIRNQFAHNLYASFTDEKVQNWCRALKWHRTAYMTPPTEATSRELFHVGVNQLACHLSGIVSIARSEKRLVRPYG